MVTKTLILKFLWRIKRLKIVNTLLKEKNEAGKQTFSDVKTYEATITRPALYWVKVDK